MALRHTSLRLRHCDLQGIRQRVTPNAAGCGAAGIMGTPGRHCFLVWRGPTSEGTGAESRMSEIFKDGRISHS